MIQEILELQKNLREKRFEFCSKHLKKDKKIIYFAYGMLQKKYIYSTFNIWYALNKFSDKYKVIIGGVGESQNDINKEDILIPSKFQSGDETVLPKTIDYLVLPFVNYDIKKNIEKIRKQNKNIIICYQVDFDFTDVASKNKELKTYQDNKEIIFENIRLVDKVIFNNENLCNFFIKNKEKYKLDGCETSGVFIKPFVNLEIFKNIKDNKPEKKKDDPKRIGILCTKENGEDLFFYKKVWQSISDKFKEKVDFQLYGNKNNSIGKSFAKIKTDFTQQTGISSYYNEIFNLNLDCVIIPTKDNSWNNNNYDLERVIEFQALGIPVLVSKIEPIKKIIVDEKNGFLHTDRDHLIRQLTVICEMDNSLDSSNMLKKISLEAFHNITENLDISKDNNIKKIEERIFEV